MSENNGLKAFTVRVPFYDTVITAAKSRDSAGIQTMEALRWDSCPPAWIDIRVLRAPEYDHLAKRAYKEHLALGDIDDVTGAVRIYGWTEQ